ncbi:Protein of unknown function DUF247 [Macleaya cordata]|uniref:Uncharacterized protein n=1 Tax=Macleaya cordata TaxID=56857 RepID=A0A200PXW0_MACCD|nr:Protein of unknown function DUF247 [Macleaya cordata]
MEVHKERALRHFVKRSREPLESYNLELMKVVHLLKESYVQLEEAWEDDDNRFIELMIRDGCFILEFLAKYWDDYAHNDPMFSYHGKIVNYNSVMQDLLMVENQLPYLVFFTLMFIGGRSAAAA